jgi:mRNA-degrading endonuclease RelE of RelBE toxin-antitoxin system
MGPARRALGRLPGKAAAAVIELAYSALAENPHRVGRPLRWELEGLRSARRGDYRVVYRVDEQAHRVDIVAVEHRADVYRTR